MVARAKKTRTPAVAPAALPAANTEPYGYVFPAIRGVQAGREYYASMCPLRLLPRLFLFNEEELVPELRAQRILNKGRLPEMTRYVLQNPNDYVFSAITASVDGGVRFVPKEDDASARLGQLHISMDARFIINDGQHRRAAIELAIREKPELADESIAVVFFIDKGLERCQQMFADLNRYAIRPPKSLGVLYDHRDGKAKLAREVASRSSVFRDVVELERSTLSTRSNKLFTLSSIYSSTAALLQGELELAKEDAVKKAVTFWDEVGAQFQEWRQVRERKMTAGDMRRDYIHSHGTVLQALGRTGNQLLHDDPEGWRKRLPRLKKINWARSNQKEWEGRAMIGGHVSKALHNILLTGNLIKKHLELPLSAEEERVESAFTRGEHAHA
jgi:DNA sulfur modification protein DndB